MTIYIDSKTDDDRSDLKELWYNLSKITAHICNDNSALVDKVYPLDIRKQQMVTIKTLILEIEKHHQ